MEPFFYLRSLGFAKHDPGVSISYVPCISESDRDRHDRLAIQNMPQTHFGNLLPISFWILSFFFFLWNFGRPSWIFTNILSLLRVLWKLRYRPIKQTILFINCLYTCCYPPLLEELFVLFVAGDWNRTVVTFTVAVYETAGPPLPRIPAVFWFVKFHLYWQRINLSSNHLNKI